MDKQKVLEANKEFEKVKDHAERKKLREEHSKKLDERYDFQSVNIAEIRKKVYEEARERENAGVNAQSWFTKK